MLVEAIKKGYFGLKIKNKGDQFEVRDEKAVSKIWMKPVTSANPSVTVGVEFDGNGNVVKPAGNGGLSFKGKR